MDLTRKNFVLGVLASVAAVGVGCGDDTSSGGSGGTGGSGGSGASGAGGDGGEPAGGAPAGGAPADGGGGTAPSGGGGEGGAGGAPPGEACTETISANHGHVLEVSQADIDAAQEKTYDIQGGSPHSHLITLTAADFATLAGGGQVVVTSTTGGAHTHDVTVVCATL